jgi:lipopolysaccharide transport system ATP-binding protein
MSDIVIKAENLGKKYIIGHQAENGRYSALRDVLMQNARTLWNKTKDLAKGKPIIQGDMMEELWALKDVSFEIHRGDAVGIIGRNGAGKSTLLKILSRITEPSIGVVTIKGRVSSLLEVGTGFHPELTGRENIYLNGAILGMTRKEIKHKFDEIVAFAEIETFLDTPVKRYSSGMYVRLAFAVAAHLEPEILVVDEVLAVGDIRFQRKCIEKMSEIGAGGRTVLFVSHSMPAIARLCQRTILLDEGQVLQDGSSHQVVAAYLQTGVGTTAKREWPNLDKAPGDDVVRLRSVYLQTEDNKVVDVVDICHPFSLVMEYDVLKPGTVLTPVFRLSRQDGIIVFTALDTDKEWMQQPRHTGHYVTKAWIPGNLMSEGSVTVFAGISTISPTIKHVYERDVIAFQLVESLGGISARGQFGGEIPGIVRPLLRWATQRCEGE